MKVKKLMELLEGKEDFDVVIRESNTDNGKWMEVEDWEIEICDIGYSSRIIALDRLYVVGR